jgi:glutamyl-tRNA synthetase
MSMLPLDELVPYVRDELKSSNLWDDAWDGDRKQWFYSVVDLIRTRLHTIKDFSTLGRPYFADDFTFEEAAVQKNLKKDPRIKDSITELADMFEKLPAFDLESTEHAVRDLSEKLGIKAGLIINGVRTAVTGQAAGPGLFELLIAVGRERVIARIRTAAAQFCT